MSTSSGEPTEDAGGAPRGVPVTLGLCAFGIAVAFHRMRGLDIPSDPVEGFLAHYWAAWICWAVAAGVVWVAPPRGRRAIAAVLVVGALLRAVAWNVPVLLETDVHRYLWDGSVTSRGFNPYEFSPAEVLRFLGKGPEPTPGEAAAPRTPVERRRLAVLAADIPNAALRAHLARANHPEIPTCYPPVAQLGFAVAASLAPGSVQVWKALVATVDMLVCLLVLALLLELGREPAWVLLYAWNPLPIKEYANTGHYDPLATLFALLAVLLLMRRRAALGGAALGMGAAAKVYPLLLVPALWRRLGARGAAACAGVLALFWVPFLDIGPAAFEGLLTFVKDWEFNSSLFAVTFRTLEGLGLPEARASFLLEPLSGGRDFYVQLSLEPFFYARALLGVVLLGVLALLAWWEEDADWSVPARAYLAVGATFLVAPVADPWYLPWVLPYACVFPSPGWLLLSGTVSNYYLYFLHWSYLWWSRPLEYVPVYALFLMEAAERVRGVRAAAPPPSSGADRADTQEECAYDDSSGSGSRSSGP